MNAPNVIRVKILSSMKIHACRFVLMVIMLIQQIIFVKFVLMVVQNVFMLVQLK